MNFNSESKRTQLASAMFAKGTAGQHDTIDNANAGFRTRKTAASNSAEIDLLGALHLDIMFQERYLLNPVDVKLRFSRSKDAFCIMAAENSAYKVFLSHVSLFVKKVKLFVKKVKLSNKNRSRELYFFHKKRNMTQKNFVSRIFCGHNTKRFLRLRFLLDIRKHCYTAQQSIQSPDRKFVFLIYLVEVAH